MPGPGIPTVDWGTFHDRNGVAHVAPVLNFHYKGVKELMTGHKLTTDCFCNPLNASGQNYKIIIHYVVH
jgi:hypothetical protein